MTDSTNAATAGMDQAVDQERLRRWLATEVDQWTDDPITVELASGGRSNLTFFVTQGDRRAVLRRPPLGHVLPSAHDMEREFRVLSCLRDTDVPVPRVYGLCVDPSVIGSHFYLMERVDGRTMSSASDTAGLTAQEAAQLSLDFVDVLTRIHAVDYHLRGLEDFGRPNGYITRQVHRWIQQWERSTTRALPQMDTLVAGLLSHIPEHSMSSLVHGDYRLDNLLIAGEPDVKPLAVLDWEMSTLGDPLADVGLMLVYWSEPGDPHGPSSVATQIAGNPGFLTRRELVDHYASTTGACVDELPFYVALGYFKLAVIFEGIHRRHLSGQTLGEGFDELGKEVPVLVDQALGTLETPLG
jgi:aminoglycoside phosphotransferase (APT) family kinase protein